MTEARLTRRHLNRALLDRQQLLERSTDPLPRVVERMGGIQMQYAPSGYIALWSRMRGFTRPMLTRALETKAVIQGTLLRGTIHTVSSADYWPMLAGIRRINREWYTRVAGAALDGIDMDAAIRSARELLADGPMRFADLAAALGERGFPMPAVKALGFSMDLVRVPPSGTWDARRADLYGRSEWWTDPVDVSEDEGIEHLIRRYLGAFGPAPARDIASWMGVTVGQMKHVLDRIELITRRDEDGKPLLDLPDASLPDPDRPAPPRFIGVWEAMLLVHARRSGVLPEEHRPRIFGTKTPHSFNTFLVDGEVTGTWRFEDGEIRLDPFRPLSPSERTALEEEAQLLAELHR
ncbi:MAG: winged helix DNA-binding domain-containing protein [Chloroflexota bacterium]|nr:winged helix DNA-binding domain-containing protein [Chloroflexota bacterium]